MTKKADIVRWYSHRLKAQLGDMVTFIGTVPAEHRKLYLDACVDIDSAVEKLNNIKDALDD